jgi:hypothetical protein
VWCDLATGILEQTFCVPFLFWMDSQRYFLKRFNHEEMRKENNQVATHLTIMYVVLFRQTLTL